MTEENEGLTLNPGNTPAALQNLEQALLHAQVKEFANMRLTLVLRDGRLLSDLIFRAAMKVRERRGDSMVDCIDKVRLDRADAPPGTPSLWVEFTDIASWQVAEVRSVP